MDILVTGGAGFIGCNFARMMAPTHNLAILDKLTYAGSMDNLKGVNARFVNGDICNAADVEKAVFEKDSIVNFAAETHVDNSIKDSEPFVRTNVLGTHVLLETARKHDIERFIHISTDEVYGSIAKGFSREKDALDPRNPYSATKAAAEHLVRSYATTYGIKAMITRSSNNYGPMQNPEKFIPKIITNALSGRDIPVYGRGTQKRDWLFVEDNCDAIMRVLAKGKPGEIYNIGCGDAIQNIVIARKILKLMGKKEHLIKFVKDRPGHDARYSMNVGKVKKLGWKPKHTLDQGLKKTIEWYSNKSS